MRNIEEAFIKVDEKISSIFEILSKEIDILDEKNRNIGNEKLKKPNKKHSKKQYW